jgi:phosphatidylglycerol:prolipoprotein diacylglycerol transferase
VHPVLIEIGPLVIRWYGVMIAVACMVGLWLAGIEAERKGIAKEKIQSFFIYAIIGGIVGARLDYVLFSDFEQFKIDPMSIFAVWQGGLAIHGGILGGLLVTIFYTKLQKIPFWKLADTLTPSLILGQAIGRIGCFLNGDAHGYPTDRPWGLVYSSESPAGQMFSEQTLHPTQLYEMGFNIIIFSVLWMLRKKFKMDGQLFLLYVILYSSIRIFVEHFRADRLTALGTISAAQSIGIIGIIMGLVLSIALKWKRSLKI